MQALPRVKIDPLRQEHLQRVIVVKVGPACYLRGSSTAHFHSQVLDAFRDEIMSSGHTLKFDALEDVRGGYLELGYDHQGSEHLYAGGKSTIFGQMDHDVARGLLAEAFPEYSVMILRNLGG